MVLMSFLLSLQCRSWMLFMLFCVNCDFRGCSFDVSFYVFRFDYVCRLWLDFLHYLIPNPQIFAGLSE